MTSPYRGVVAVLALVVEHVEPGVLVEAGMVVRGLHGGRHVQTVRHGLQSSVPELRLNTRTLLLTILYFLGFEIEVLVNSYPVLIC